MEKIISPAVTFKETDLSTIPQEFVNIDTVFVGPTPKGKYFVPKTINSFAEYEELYGGVSEDEYTGLAVREFIREKGSATIVPIANVEGYNIPWVANINVSGSTIGNLTVAQIYPTRGSRDGGVDTVEISGNAGAFTLTLNSGATEVYSAPNLSLYKGDVNYIGNFDNPTSTANGFYVKYITDIDVVGDDTITGGFDGTVSKSDTVVVETSLSTPSGSALSEGRSPWVLSQGFGGEYNRLFRFKTLQEGDQVNRSIKFEISNVRQHDELTDSDAQYGLFDVTIRSYGDSEANQQVLETFPDVSLDPNATNYIARVIGDKNISYDEVNKVLVENGFYNNSSNYIYVEMGSVKDFPKNAVPFGFERYDHSGTYFTAGEAPSYMVYNGNDDGYVAGVNFDGLSKEFLDSIHKELSDANSFLNVGTNKDAEAFKMAETVASIADPENRRFVFGVFGSSKGVDESIPKNVGAEMSTANTFGMDFSSNSSNGYLSYERALNIIQDDETYDLKMLVLPAINMEHHNLLVNRAVTAVEDRKDVFLIIDATGEGAIPSTASQLANSFDTTYAGAYYPWVQFNIGGKIRLVPPTVVVPSAFAYNDKVAHPWYAPFGFNRGVLFNAVKPVRKLLKKDRDDLITKNVNPITSILNEGTVILGQETLQKRNTALSKINVRRLLIEAKKFIATVSWKVLGEPINDNTRALLETTINNYLDSVRRDNGLEAFRVDFGSGINTPDVVNRGLIRGVIELVPTRSLEGIQINFVIRNSGVTFND